MPLTSHRGVSCAPRQMEAFPLVLILLLLVLSSISEVHAVKCADLFRGPHLLLSPEALPLT
jgi:hypothetical protein